MNTIYLCGPINGCTDEGANGWRTFVIQVSPHFKHINPMRRDYRGKEDLNVNEIVELDKIDIMKCDAILVNYDKPSVGTSMEVLFAFERGKLVVVVAPPDVSISPWLRYHSHRIEPSFAEALVTIKELLA
jgi:nucleoside 2-deoxyribosyltransferase